LERQESEEGEQSHLQAFLAAHATEGLSGLVADHGVLLRVAKTLGKKEHEMVSEEVNKKFKFRKRESLIIQAASGLGKKKESKPPVDLPAPPGSHLRKNLQTPQKPTAKTPPQIVEGRHVPIITVCGEGGRQGDKGSSTILQF